MPAAGASPTTSGVVFRSCDPGNQAQTPSNARIRAAVRLVAARDDLVVALVHQPLPTSLAVCAARLLVRQPDFAQAITSGASLDHPTPQMLRESADAGVACRGNPNAGIP
jgi:hypothetical protein